MDARRIGIIGFGAIGEALAARLPGVEGARLAAVLVRERGAAAARERLAPDIAVATDRDAFLSIGLDLVVECAGQEAVRAHAAPILAAGVPLMVISTGALAAPGVLDSLLAACAGPARLLVPAGAIAGLDGLGALKEAGLTGVTYTSTKPPLAWRGTPAEARLDLAALTEPVVFFEGSAREAALAYPKNANLAATVALAGMGLDATRVRLVADPAATGNTGRIDAESAIGTLTVTMAGEASANPKTSASVAFSLLQAIRSGGARLVI
jgi:aspartate dehydrogenase